MFNIKRLIDVNKAEIDVFLEFSCFFDDPADVGKLISGSSAFSKTSLNIWKSMVHILLKPGLENFEHYFTSGDLFCVLEKSEHLNTAGRNVNWYTTVENRMEVPQKTRNRTTI